MIKCSSLCFLTFLSLSLSFFLQQAQEGAVAEEQDAEAQSDRPDPGMYASDEAELMIVEVRGPRFSH